MPAPESLEWREGRLVVARFTMGLRGADDGRVAAALERFAARLAERTGTRFPRTVQRGRQATLTAEAAAAGLPVQAVGEDESYELAVDSRQVRLAAPNPLGVLRGLETLLNSRIPCVGCGLGMEDVWFPTLCISASGNYIHPL